MAPSILVSLLPEAQKQLRSSQVQSIAYAKYATETDGNMEVTKKYRKYCKKERKEEEKKKKKINFRACHKQEGNYKIAATVLLIDAEQQKPRRMSASTVVKQKTNTLH